MNYKYYKCFNLVRTQPLRLEPKQAFVIIRRHIDEGEPLVDAYIEFYSRGTWKYGKFEQVEYLDNPDRYEPITDEDAFLEMV